jgi:Tetracyclin repressor-like, C-terminal domain
MSLYRRLLLTQPGLIALTVSRPMLGPNALRLREDMLTLLRRGGLNEADAVSAFLARFAYTTGFVTFETARTPGKRDAEQCARAQQLHEVAARGVLSQHARPASPRKAPWRCRVHTRTSRGDQRLRREHVSGWIVELVGRRSGKSTVSAPAHGRSSQQCSRRCHRGSALVARPFARRGRAPSWLPLARETPLNTVSRRFGISTLTSLRFFSRAACTRIGSWRSVPCSAGNCVCVLVAMLIAGRPSAARGVSSSVISSPLSSRARRSLPLRRRSTPSARRRSATWRRRRGSPRR